jgi:hypothetical protein
MSDDLFPRRDVRGEPIRSEGGVGPDFISPIWTGTARNNPTLQRLIDAGMRISPPQRTYSEGGKRIDWTPAQYDRLQAITGQLARPELDALVRGKGWNAMSHDRQQDAISDLMKAAKAGAKAAVRQGGMFGAPMKNAAPASNVTDVPPPPPGFTVQ